MIKIGLLPVLLTYSVFPVDADELIGSATGFAVNTSGHVLTNAHVVSECSNVTVKIGGLELPVQIVSIDAHNDLALLKISGVLSTVLSLREGTRVQLGESVIAFGYPLQGVISTSLNMTIGNISALAGIDDDTRSLQFTAPIQPGNSGGPLVDASGNVVGIVTSKLSPLWAAKNIGDLPQNVNFALKASVIRDFFESHGVDYQAKSLAATIPVTDIPGKVSGAVFALQCFGTRQNKDPKPVPVNRAESPIAERRPGLLIAGYGAAEYFQSIFLEVENALTTYGVLIANRPAEIGTVTGDSASIQNLIGVLQQRGHDSLLYLTVENTGFKIRANVQCFDSKGVLLWQQKITNRFSITFEGAVRNVVDQLKKMLKTRAGKPGLGLALR
jgi:hypothetical protein